MPRTLSANKPTCRAINAHALVCQAHTIHSALLAVNHQKPAARRGRAFDATSGRQLWEARLDNNANANPMSYRGKSGKQYVAINAGGSVVVYSLP